MSTTYMTARLKLADGTYLYPQISLDNMVKSLQDSTAVSVVTTVGASGVATNNQIPTAAAVRSLADTKQNTLVAGPGTEIINGSTVMATVINLNDMVIDQEPTNGVHLTVSLDGNTVSAAVELAGATEGVAGTVLGATNGVTLDGGVVTGLFGDGVEVVGNTAKVDIATVAETLNGTAGSNMVDADGLKGAMSLGQAVDVSCAPLECAPDKILVDVDGTPTWVDTTQELLSSMYLSQFSLKYTGTGSYPTVGFGNTTASFFPKYADNLNYLYMADVKLGDNETDTASVRSTYKVQGDSTWKYTAWQTISKDSWTRVYLPLDWKVALIQFTGITGKQIDIKNFRQYEVTALTDDAIQYLASAITNPNPDNLFRSDDFFAIRNRYLIKSDMVNPWTYLIEMPLNTPAATIGAGLAYQLRFMDGGEHQITVDTFPVNAYGADAHIQLLLSNNSTVVFNPPLNLIDPLTNNAAHNITVKFRAGQANVYVDDMDSGYIVTVSAGTESGSLYLGITGSTAEYIIFSPDINGSTITEVPTITRDVNIVGNGQENTILSPDTGIISIRSGANLSHMSFVNMHRENGGVVLYTETPANKIVTLSDITLSGSTSSGHSLVYLTSNAKGMTQITGCTFTNNYAGNWQFLVLNHPGQYKLSDCKFVDNNGDSSSTSLICVTNVNQGYYVWVDNCLFDNKTSNMIAVFIHSNACAFISNSTFATSTDRLRFLYASGVITFDGTNVFNSYIYNSGTDATMGVVGIIKDSTLDLSGNTISTPVFSKNNSNASITGTTIGVLASPTNRVIEGTATVLYSSALDGELDGNNEPFVKSRTITGGGTGYIMRNNGSIGVPVTTTTAGQAGSLDTLLADATVQQITFAPVVDVDTPTTGGTISLSSENINVDRDVRINGAGAAKTVLGNNWIDIDSSHTLYASGLTKTGSGGFTGKYLYMDHILFTGTGKKVEGNYSGARLYITDCRFSNCSNASYVVTSANNSRIYFTNVTVSGCSCNSFAGDYGTSGYPDTYVMTNCVFAADNVWSTDRAFYSTFKNGSTISGCTFGVGNNIMTVVDTGVITFIDTNVFDATISGPATVAFADGATVTSTIPSGQTRGTGTIRSLIDMTSTGFVLENVTVTGVSASVSTATNPLMGKPSLVKNCLITGNSITGVSYGRIFKCDAGEELTIEGSTVTGNFTENSQGYNYNWSISGSGNIVLKDSVVDRAEFNINATVTLTGTVSCMTLLPTAVTSVYTLTISPAAVVQVTGNLQGGNVTIGKAANITAPNGVASITGGTVTVATGGCTVNGHAVAAGTYSKINADGTTEPVS